MVSRITEVWKKLKNHYCDKIKAFNVQNVQNVKRNIQNITRNNISKFFKTNVNIDDQNVGNPKDNESKPWKNLVTPVLCPYAKMGKPFNDVLRAFDKIDDTQIITKRFEDGDEFYLMARLKRCNQNQQKKNDSWEIKVESKSKILDMFKPYIVVGDEQKFGFKFKTENINNIISSDIGIRQKFCANHNSSNAFYASAQYTHPAMVIDAKYEMSQYVQQNVKLFNIEFSPVFGRRFNKFGVMAGLNFKLNNSPDSSLTNICQAVSLGMVFPNAASRLTINPNEGECVVDGYWKVSNKLEVAASLKSHIINPDLMRHNQEIGMKYKYSDGISYLFKTDLAGNISAGLWLKEKLFTLGICFQKNVIENRDDTRKVGVSLEF